MTIALRKTKIICTLGPATESPERLREMILAGTNIFRLNMSHAQHDWVRQIVPTIRGIAAELDMPVGILLDTQGPAVRTGDLPTKLNLKVGDIMEFTVRGARSEELYSVNVKCRRRPSPIRAGSRWKLCSTLRVRTICSSWRTVRGGMPSPARTSSI